MAGMGVNMGLTQEHELHGRRRKRNALVGLVLLGFVVMVFGITLVKLKNGRSMEAFDHSIRPALVEVSE